MVSHGKNKIIFKMSANVRFGVFLRAKIVPWKTCKHDAAFGVASSEGFFHAAKEVEFNAHETDEALQASEMPDANGRNILRIPCAASCQGQTQRQRPWL